MGAGDADHIVTEIPHQPFESIAMKVSSSMMSTSVAISGRHFPSRNVGGAAGLGHVGRENERDSSSEKPSSDSSRKAWRGNGVIFESRRSGGQRQGGDVAIIVDRDRIPDLGKQPKRPARGPCSFVGRDKSEQGFKHGADIGVARRLISGQGRA